jgi:Zn-finger nucleic acid-binding protein
VSGARQCLMGNVSMLCTAISQTQEEKIMPRKVYSWRPVPAPTSEKTEREKRDEQNRRSRERYAAAKKEKEKAKSNAEDLFDAPKGYKPEDLGILE